MVELHGRGEMEVMSSVKYDTFDLPDGRDITSDVAPAFRNTRFQLAERAEIADCESLLR